MKQKQTSQDFLRVGKLLKLQKNLPIPACGLLGADCGLGSIGIEEADDGVEGVETVFTIVFVVMLGAEGKLKPIVLPVVGVAEVVPGEPTTVTAVGCGTPICRGGEGELGLAGVRSFSHSLAAFIDHEFPLPASSIIAFACSTRLSLQHLHHISHVKA